MFVFVCSLFISIVCVLAIFILEKQPPSLPIQYLPSPPLIFAPLPFLFCSLFSFLLSSFFSFLLFPSLFCLVISLPSPFLNFSPFPFPSSFFYPFLLFSSPSIQFIPFIRQIDRFFSLFPSPPLLIYPLFFPLLSRFVSSVPFTNPLLQHINISKKRRN